RPARVPSGKSHSGASPATGLYTQCTVRAPRCASHRKVALLAERIRPITVSSPPAKVSPSSGSPSALDVITGSGQLTAPVAVGAHTDVPVRVERFLAQRARWPAGRDDPVGPRRELPGRLG